MLFSDYGQSKNEKLRTVDFLSMSPSSIAGIMQFPNTKAKMLYTIKEKDAMNEGIEYFKDVYNLLIEARKFIGDDEQARRKDWWEVMTNLTTAHPELGTKWQEKTEKLSPAEEEGITKKTKKSKNAG